MKSSRRLSTCCVVAISAVVLIGSGLAAAEPVAPVVPEASSAPADNPLVRGPAQPGDLLGAYREALDVLRELGIDPFLYPTVAASCGDGPQGVVPAVAGVVPGPWPETLPVPMPGLDPAAVDAGQVLFAFVPYGIDAEAADTDATGMQVVWLNVSNGRGGTAGMGSIGDVVNGMIPPEVSGPARLIAEAALQQLFIGALPAGGIRAVPVDTGKGTVLAAVFGTVRNGERSCVFLPTVGITTVS